ncbi:MAG: hypothetical protein ACK5NT_07200 [Pyrinomonadaceae bacterium]
MDPERTKRDALEKLTDAINFAVEQSPMVLDAIENLRELGIEPEVNMRLEILLNEFEEEPDVILEESFVFTDDDIKTLERMRIKID